MHLLIIFEIIEQLIIYEDFLQDYLILLSVEQKSMNVNIYQDIFPIDYLSSSLMLYFLGFMWLMMVEEVNSP